MKIELIEPEHRCKKCKTPLDFKHNHLRNDKERDEYISKLSGWKQFWCGRWDYLFDYSKQYWGCPKCFEEYLVKR